jgi:DNA-binding MarR family transcriptional regulator
VPRRRSLPTRRVLLALLDAPGRESYATELARATGIEPGTVSAILQRLEDEGLLRSRWSRGDPRPGQGLEPRRRLRRRYFALTQLGTWHATEPGAQERTALRLTRATGVPAQLVLHALLAAPGHQSYPRELSAVTGLTSSSVSAILRRHARDGLVRACPGHAVRPERNAGRARHHRRFYALTGDGHRRLRETPPAEREAIGLLLASAAGRSAPEAPQPEPARLGLAAAH